LIVTVNARIADEIKTHFAPACPIVVAPNGYHPTPAFARAPQEAPASYLFYSGQLYSQKGVDSLVQAMAHLPDDHLIIAGGNQPKDVERIVREIKLHGVESRVTLLGQIPQRDVAHWGQFAKALMLPNTQSAYNEAYTCPLKLMEYLSYAKPIIASNLPTIASVVTHKEHALLVEPGKPKAISDGVKHLNDATLSNHLGEQAKVQSQHHTWEKRVETIIAHLNP
jgi:glycosyltransferase involved in cell wall biosynthesis